VRSVVYQLLMAFVDLLNFSTYKIFEDYIKRQHGLIIVIL